MSRESIAAGLAANFIATPEGGWPETVRAWREFEGFCHGTNPDKSRDNRLRAVIRAMRDGCQVHPTRIRDGKASIDINTKKEANSDVRFNLLVPKGFSDSDNDQFHYRGVCVEGDGSVLAWDTTSDSYSRHHDISPDNCARARNIADKIRAGKARVVAGIVVYAQGTKTGRFKTGEKNG